MDKDTLKKLVQGLESLPDNNEQVVRFLVERVGESKQCSVEIKKGKSEREWTVKTYSDDSLQAAKISMQVDSLLDKHYSITGGMEIEAKLKKAGIELPKQKMNLANLSNKKVEDVKNDVDIFDVETE